MEHQVLKVLRETRETKATREIPETPEAEPPATGGALAAPPEEPQEPTSPPPSSPSEAPSTLTMLSISTGEVLVLKAGTDEWIKAEVGMSLEIGDMIRSGQDSSAEITFFDGSTIELEAGTQIEVAMLEIAADTGSTTIFLKQEVGKTISRVTNLTDPASRYEVETPAGVAAVRGSTMVVEVIDDTTLVTCVEGDIWVLANGVALKVPVGRTCSVARPKTSGEAGHLETRPHTTTDRRRQSRSLVLRARPTDSEAA